MISKAILKPNQISNMKNAALTALLMSIKCTMLTVPRFSPPLTLYDCVVITCCSIFEKILIIQMSSLKNLYFKKKQYF